MGIPLLHDPMAHFEDLSLSPPLLQVIQELGYEIPSPIQAQSIPPLLLGRDLVGQAQTGTGKTAAFALPLLQRLNLSLRKPQALILTPTRELALQVSEAMQTYARHLPGFAISALYGGQGMHTQLRELARGVHVVVGTPGRILDHLRRKTLLLDSLVTVILDEADEMLRMGFLEDVETILEQTPQTKQVGLFSATMPDAIKRVAQRHLRQPVEVQIRTKTATVSTIDQRYWKVVGAEKIEGLSRIIEAEESEAILIFVRTKVAATEIADKLQSRGFVCGVLSGDLNQAQREAIVEQLKHGGCDILVATDVAARGLDIDRISHVINFDIPFDPETYVHRIGRTGRAGRSGQAILFVEPREMRILRTIEKVTRQPIKPMALPSLAEIIKRRTTAFKKKIQATLASQELGFFETMLREFQDEQKNEPLQIAAALAFLLQEARPLVPPSMPEDTASRGNNERWILPADADIDASMRSYRIEVGRQHGVLPKHIVGALTNEMQLEGRYIGQIKLYDTFSIVDLPGEMPSSVLFQLKKLRVRGQPLRMSPLPENLSGPRSKTSAPAPARLPKREAPSLPLDVSTKRSQAAAPFELTEVPLKKASPPRQTSEFAEISEAPSKKAASPRPNAGNPVSFEPFAKEIPTPLPAEDTEDPRPRHARKALADVPSPLPVEATEDAPISQTKKSSVPSPAKDALEIPPAPAVAVSPSETPAPLVSKPPVKQEPLASLSDSGTPDDQPAPPKRTKTRKSEDSAAAPKSKKKEAKASKNPDADADRVLKALAEELDIPFEVAPLPSKKSKEPQAPIEVFQPKKARLPKVSQDVPPPQQEANAAEKPVSSRKKAALSKDTPDTAPLKATKTPRTSHAVANASLARRTRKAR